MKKMKILLPVLLMFSLLLSACSSQQDNEVVEVEKGVEALGNYSEELIDLADLKGTAVFTDVALERPSSMRGLGVDAKNGAFYITQSYGSLPSDVMIGKVEAVDGVWQATEWMHTYESGYGYLSIEAGDDGNVNMWIESNGTLEDMGTTISYVGWENEALIQREYGQTFSFDKLDGYISAQVDVENDWLVIRVSSTDGDPYYAFYDRSSILAGEEAECLYKVSCAAGQKPTDGKDDSKGRYGTITYRGFAVGGGYIYQLHGNSQGKIYVSAFDLEGNLAYCHLIKEYSDMSYREPNALSYVDGKLYMLITSGDSGDRLANVLTFE